MKWRKFRFVVLNFESNSLWFWSLRIESKNKILQLMKFAQFLRLRLPRTWDWGSHQRSDWMSSCAEQIWSHILWTTLFNVTIQFTHCNILCTIDLSSYCTLLTSTVAEFSFRGSQTRMQWTIVFWYYFVIRTCWGQTAFLYTILWDLMGSRTDHHLAQKIQNIKRRCEGISSIIVPKNQFYYKTILKCFL